MKFRKQVKIMTLEQYKNLIEEFDLYHYDESCSGSQYGPDAYLDRGHTESVCGWRRNRREFVNNDKSWKAHSLIMYEHGCWNGKYATTIKEGRKLLNEYFRNKKLKHIAEKKAEIILASKVFHI